MPSPVAHSLAGAAVAFIAIRSGVVSRQWVFWLGSLAFAANAPDLDFVPGVFVGEPGIYHHGPTHSLAASVVFAVAAWMAAAIARLADPRQFALLMGLGYLSHVLLDFLTIDTRAPFGMALYWPFTSRIVSSPVQIFVEIWTAGRRTFWLSLLQWHNAWAILRELVIMTVLLGGLAVVVSLLRRYRTERHS